MSKLVEHLSEGKHPVVIAESRNSLVEFRQRVEEMGYVFVTFSQTQGETRLGIRVDKNTTDLSHADFEHGTGMVHLEGLVTLDYVRVRCVADIDLSTLRGSGHLVVLEAVHP